MIDGMKATTARGADYDRLILAGLSLVVAILITIALHPYM